MTDRATVARLWPQGGHEPTSVGGAERWNAIGTTDPGGTDRMTTETIARDESGPARIPDRLTSILVADDEHLVAGGIAANLAELGFTVVGPASDGQEALDLCRNARPDMALLDIRMPRLDGLAAAKAIHEELGIPVVLLSAYADPEFIDRAGQAGTYGYLLKPITPDQLRAAVTVAWSRHCAAAERRAEILALQERLENRKIIEQAKWILVDRKGLDEPEAMRRLQRHARNNRRTLVDIAQSIIENLDLFDD